MQKSAYEVRISDWSSDVCSSDLPVDVKTAPVIRGRIAYHRGRLHVVFACLDNDVTDRIDADVLHGDGTCLFEDRDTTPLFDGTTNYIGKGGVGLPQRLLFRLHSPDSVPSVARGVFLMDRAALDSGLRPALMRVEFKGALHD